MKLCPLSSSHHGVERNSSDPAARHGSWIGPTEHPQGAPLPPVVRRYEDVIARQRDLGGRRGRPARRQITVKPPAQHEAIQAARTRQETDEFTATYALRAGVERPISQGVRPL